jgi:inosine-uridine nucleoside N-ribohydrolase
MKSIDFPWSNQDSGFAQRHIFLFFRLQILYPMRTTLVFLAAWTIGAALAAQPRIIFDTDFGGDADDLGALAMLHHFVDRRECELLAVMCWSTERYAVPAIDAVNRYYGHPDIPIGVRKGGVHLTDWNYSKPIADRFPNTLDHTTAPEATALYRQILRDSPDSSVIVVTVGPLMNIQNLIQSGPDSISELSGRALINRKVKEFVVMGGKFPEGNNEWNFDGDMPGVTRFVVQQLEVPIVFSGFEVGIQLKTGERINDLNPSTPLYTGFMHFSRLAPWMKEYFRGRILDNSSYDQTAVLYAVRNGTGLYWDKITGGRCVPDETGGNTWVPAADSRHAYLRLKMDAQKLSDLIESIMLGGL